MKANQKIEIITVLNNLESYMSKNNKLTVKILDPGYQRGFSRNLEDFSLDNDRAALS